MKTLQITMSVLITMEVVSSSAIILLLGIGVNVKMAMHWQTMDTHAMVTLQSTTFFHIWFLQFQISMNASVILVTPMLHVRIPMVALFVLVTTTSVVMESIAPDYVRMDINWIIQRWLVVSVETSLQSWGNLRLMLGNSFTRGDEIWTRYIIVQVIPVDFSSVCAYIHALHIILAW